MLFIAGHKLFARAIAITAHGVATLIGSFDSSNNRDHKKGSNGYTCNSDQYFIHISIVA